MSHRDELQKAVYEQQLIVNAIHSDLSNPERLEESISRKRKQVQDLCDEIAILEHRLDALPEVLAKAEKKLQSLRRAANIASNPDVAKLLRLAKKVEDAQGKDH